MLVNYIISSSFLCKMGMENSFFLYRLKRFINENKTDRQCSYKGRCWMRGTIETLHTHLFPFIEIKQLENTINYLEKSEYILIHYCNKETMDITLTDKSLDLFSICDEKEKSWYKLPITKVNCIYFFLGIIMAIFCIIFPSD